MTLLPIALALVAAPNWVRLGPSPGGITYFDPAGTVVLDAGRRRVRVHFVYHQVRENGAASESLLAEIDCVNRSATGLEMQILDAAGTVIETRTVAPVRRQLGPADRGGPEEAQLMRMCRTVPE